MSDKAWDEAMAMAQRANLEMLRGNPEPIKRLYSHRDDVTVLGGFGGFERGWNEVEPRLDWAASHFSGGRYRQEEVAAIMGVDLAMTVTIERYTVRIDGGEETAQELRVTQVFRLEDGAWKLVHRHADPLVHNRNPQ